MPFKIRAIYYKSKWPLIIRGNFFFSYKLWLKKLGGGWADQQMYPSFTSKRVGRVHFCQFGLGVGAGETAGGHSQSTTLTAPLPSTFQQPTSALPAASDHVALPPEK